jgi:signal transduction histidine kinase
MTLPDFIEDNLDILVADWTDQLLRLGLRAKLASGLAPHEPVRQLLKALAQDMRQEQSSEHQLAKGRGERPLNAPDVTREAREHADDRLSRGFSINDVVAEYRALRASVARHWMPVCPDGNRLRLANLVRLDEAIDQALSEAVARYSSELERTRDLFVGILAHDLRTPLGAIMMSAQYLMRLEDLPARALQTTATVQRSGERMQRIISDLLDVTRARLGGTFPVSVRSTNLGNVCRQVIAEVQALHPDENVRWISDGDLSGTWDSERLSQLLTNLLENAIDHGTTGSTIIVTTNGLADTVKLSVFNEGTPIEPAAWQEIFDPLAGRSPGAEPRRAGAGLGLGLFIARQIALAHGGTLEVNSDAAGTSFIALLPRVAPA